MNFRERLAGWIAPSLVASTPAPTDDFWFKDLDVVTTAAGIRLSPAGAQKVSAWYRGRLLLATSLAMLPLCVYRRLPNDRGREKADEYALYDVLHRKPNTFQDSYQWRRQKMFNLIDYGNSYDRIVGRGKSFADALIPIDPTLVTPELLDNVRMAYTVRNPKTGETKVYGDDQIFHLRGASDDGVIGKGVLEHARDSVALGLTIETYAARLFSKGGSHAGHIETPAALKPDAGKRMAESFLAKYGNWHVPAVLEQGAVFKPSTMEPEKLQMLLSRKFAVNDIARWLGLPPHMIGDLDRATFTNIEHQGQEFVTYSLGPWLSLFEYAINDQLILQPYTYYAEFTRDALVRGDLATRWEKHVKSVNAGIESVNEVRALENLNAVEGMDEPRIPQNIAGKPEESAEKTPKPEKPSENDDDDEKAYAIATAAASRLLRKEIKAVTKFAVKWAANQDEFAIAVTEFYQAHASLVAETLSWSELEAKAYCAGQASQVVSGDWVTALETWSTPSYAAGLAGLALEAA